MKNMALDILTLADQHRESIALRHKRDEVWHQYTYGQLQELVDQMAAGLVARGIKPGERVGICSPNLPQWIMADLAIQSIRAVTVPIYATNSAEQMVGIINDSKLGLLFVGGQSEASKAEEARPFCPGLGDLVVLDDAVKVTEPAAVPLADLLHAHPTPEVQADLQKRRESARSDDLATLIYTSGTTGEPKGVQLTHANFVNQFTTLDSRFQVGAADHSLCFLPLSHAYERAWTTYVLRTGAANSILRDPRQVATALAEVRPTVMVSAPRLYEKVHSTIMTKVGEAPVFRRKLFHWAIGVGKQYWSRRHAGQKAGSWLTARYRLADSLVLKKVRKVMGGPKNFLSSGGAALDISIEEFFQGVGLLICQGYGLTETAPMLTCNSPGAFKFGTVGKPIDGVTLRIDEETGEILARGPNVTSGYFGRPEATLESFQDGWFRTGDIGHLDEDGFLVITDRIKDIIVTSGGKNVAPQRIETLVGKDHYIDQLAVVGDRRKFISAIVVPAFENLVEFAKRRKLPFKDHEDLINLPEVVEFYTQRIREQSRQLAPFEKIKRFTLVARAFSQQAGEITPTLKIRRKVVAEKYQQLIERMYGGDKAGADPE
jgi:long-chain acyl-CoA synthetase